MDDVKRVLSIKVLFLLYVLEFKGVFMGDCVNMRELLPECEGRNIGYDVIFLVCKCIRLLDRVRSILWHL